MQSLFLVLMDLPTLAVISIFHFKQGRIIKSVLNRDEVYLHGTKTESKERTNTEYLLYVPETTGGPA